MTLTARSGTSSSRCSGSRPQPGLEEPVRGRVAAQRGAPTRGDLGCRAAVLVGGVREYVVRAANFGDLVRLCNLPSDVAALWHTVVRVG